jgi:hypothetical protein
MKKAVTECSSMSMVLESQQDDRRVSLGEKLLWRHGRGGGQRWMSFISIQWRKDLTAGKIFLFEVDSVLTYRQRLDNVVRI